MCICPETTSAVLFANHVLDRQSDMLCLNNPILGQPPSNTYMDYAIGDTTSLEWRVIALTGTLAVDSGVRLSTSEPAVASPSISSTALNTDSGIAVSLSFGNTGFDSAVSPTDYLVVLRTHNNTETEIAQITGTSFIDTKIQPGESYSYRIYAVRDGISGDKSEVSSITIPNIEFYEVVTSADLSQLIPISGFQVQISPSAPVSYEKYEVLIGSKPDELVHLGVFETGTITISSLLAGQTYYLEIYGLGINGTRVSSRPLTLSFTTEFSSEEILTKPTLSLYDYSYSHVNLTWTSAKGATHYMVCRGATDYEINCLQNTGLTSFTDMADLNANQSIFYQVIAVNGLFQSSSNVLEVTIPENPLENAGDINGDGEVNLQDIIIGLQTITGTSNINSIKDADINGDGKIGLAEIIYDLNKVSQP